jgi:hypothetical protein
MNWPKKPYKWNDNGRLHISIPFTWQLPEIRRYLEATGIDAVVGGPAVKLMPKYLSGVAEIGNDIPGILQRINPLATRTTEGCVNACGFCGVPTIEPIYSELSDWPVLPIVCDNNLLAASGAHFNSVIDKLKLLPDTRIVDFNQGLDARLMTPHHASRLAELGCLCRIAFDNTKLEKPVFKAIDYMVAAGIPKRNIRCYVLIGFNDTPEDALYRLQTLWSYGVTPNPMRYTPLNSLTGKYVGENWTNAELIRYMRYWANLRATQKVPFDEFCGGVQSQSMMLDLEVA